ncbi:MAG: hypothetical protein ACI4PW_04270 [Alphaproteobacteria bacterium]
MFSVVGGVKRTDVFRKTFIFFHAAERKFLTPAKRLKRRVCLNRPGISRKKADIREKCSFIGGSFLNHKDVFLSYRRHAKMSLNCMGGNVFYKKQHRHGCEKEHPRLYNTAMVALIVIF